MKKRLLALLLVTFMLTAMISVSAFAEEAPVWTANGTTVAEGENGFYNVSGIQYSTTAYTTEKVKLDGLTVDVKISGMGYYEGSNQAVGLIFGSHTGTSYGSAAVAMTLWHDPYANGQTRFHVGTNHDYNGASLAYTDAGCTNAGFGLAASMVLNKVTDIEYTVAINSHDENTYAVTFTAHTPHLLWDANANYQAVEGGVVTFYMKKADFASALDENGELYLAVGGLANASCSVKVTAVASEKPETPVEPETPVASIIGQADSDWKTYSGNATSAFADNDYTAVSGLSAWGSRAYYQHLVKFDGLELSFRATTNTGDCVGVIFSGSAGAYFGDGSPFSITYWNNLYTNQARLHFGSNHNYNSESVVYTAPDGAKKGFGVAGSMVCSQAPTMGWTIKFASYNEEYYSVKITMTDSTMWGNNANYNAEELSCTVYLPKATVAGMLNENGECYVIAAGFPSGANPACTAEYKIVDDNYRAYIGGTGVANAIEKVTAYQNAAASITDAASYDAAMAARAAAVACAGDLRARELAQLSLLVGAVDAELAANEEIVVIVKKAVTDKIDAAKAAYDAFVANNASLNNDALAAALALTNDAKAEYTLRAAMLSDAAKAEIEAGLAGLDYAHDYSIALLWVVEYEAKVAALDATSATIVDGIVDAKAFKEAYVTTTAYTKITTVLTEGDKAALEGRIAAADAAVVNLETVVLPQLKESYIVAMEEKLAADLTIKPNLDDAKAAYADIALYVTITEADGELYARYVAGYEALKAACETYTRTVISEVSALLDVQYTILDEFKSVRNKFKTIKLDYLMEENEEIKAEFAALEAKIMGNVFYYVTSTGIPVVEWNDRGLAVESKVEFPARLNYNKLLDLRAGAEVVVELTSAAYYNPGSSANNLCFNFLGAPDSYKSMSDGISIIIWLFPAESNVQIMNNTDVPLASASIATPLDGGNINISVKYEEYYSFVEDATYWAYVIKVNEAEIVLTAETLTNNGHTMPNEVYFSMGSFADDKSNPNILTLVSVNGVELGIPSEEPECTAHVDADKNGKCDNCGADVEVTKPDDNKPAGDDKNEEEPAEELSFAQKLGRFFRGIFEAIANFFKRLFGKVE